MTHALDAWSKQIWAILDPNPELTITLREAINKAQQLKLTAIEEPTLKPRSVVEDFDFIRARIQEIRANTQTWWCSHCNAHRTQGCNNVVCPRRITEDYCYD